MEKCIKIEEELISIETAKLIPDPKSVSVWNSCLWFYIDTAHPKGYWFGNRNTLDIDYPAPTLGFLHKWLRKHHSFFVTVDFVTLDVQGFMVLVIFFDENEDYHIMKTPIVNKVFKDYDDAMEEGLRAALNLIP